MHTYLSILLKTIVLGLCQLRDCKRNHCEKKMVKYMDKASDHKLLNTNGKEKFLHRLKVWKLRNIRWKNSGKIQTLEHSATIWILTPKYQTIELHTNASKILYIRIVTK